MEECAGVQIFEIKISEKAQAFALLHDYEISYQ